MAKRRGQKILVIGRKNLELILYQADFHPKDKVRYDSSDNEYQLLHTDQEPILKSLEDVFIWLEEDQLNEEYLPICVFCRIESPSLKNGRLIGSFDINEFVINPKQEVDINKLSKETIYKMFGIRSPTLQEELQTMNLKQISLDSSLNFSFFVTISTRFFNAFNEMQAKKERKKGGVEYIHRINKYSSPTYFH